MPASIITKQALAAGFRTLMEKSNYDQISVTDICSQCTISRKSFYYHFRDKKDLIDWIFYHDCADRLVKEDIKDFWLFYKKLAAYIFDNRKYYMKLMQANSDNYLHDILTTFLTHNLENNIHDYLSTNKYDWTREQQLDCLDFLGTTFTASIENWLLKHPKLTIDTFIEIIQFDKLVRH